MSRRKQRQREEEIVELVEEKNKEGGFLQNNQFLFLGILALGALLIGGILAYSLLYKAPRDAKAMSAMYKAEEQFKKDSFALALENPGGGFDGFLDIIDNYNGTKAANLAKYYAGISYLNLGNFDAAIEYLSSSSPGGSVLPITKYGALADCYSEKQDFAQAIEFYERAVNTQENEFLTPYYLRKLALLHERQGNSEAANTYFRKIKEDFPNSDEGQVIDKYITM